MANLPLDTIHAMDPGSADPIGTLQEVRALGLPPVKYGSCSRPGPNNRGCGHFDSEKHGPCPVAQLCKAKGRKGYEKVAFLRILSPTVMKQDACMCHQYMDALAHADPRSGVTHIIGLGGDVIIKRRTSVVDPANPKAPPKTMLVTEKVLPAPRPDVTMADRTANLQLARELTAKQAQTMAESFGAAALRDAEEAPEDGETAPPEDFDDMPDESGTTDVLDSLDEDAGDGLSSGDEDELLNDREPEAVAAVSRRGRRRG